MNVHQPRYLQLLSFDSRKHLFDETTARAEVASHFCIMAAQLHKAVTGVDYQSSPHPYKGKQKATNTDSTTPTKLQKTDASPSPAPSTSGETPSEKAPAKGTAHEDRNRSPSDCAPPSWRDNIRRHIVFKQFRYTSQSAI